MTGTNRLPCQGCGQMLVPLADGTARRHGRYGGCKGSGFRLARWEVGQLLIHHTGSVWVVEEDRGGPWCDYFIRCIDTSYAINDNEAGRSMVTHGEYMHRHGWEPVEDHPRIAASVAALQGQQAS